MTRYRMLIITAVGLLALAGTTARAQSIEETYASLCSDAKAAKNEACTALRQALLAKLTAGDATPPATASVRTPTPPATPTGAATSVPTTLAPTPAPAEIPAEWRARFGPLAGLGGKRLFARAGSFVTLSDYRWAEPGRVLVNEGRLADGSHPSTATYTYDEANRRLVLTHVFDGGPPTTLYPVLQADGSLLLPPSASPNYRVWVRERPEGGLRLDTETRKGGRWVPSSSSEMPIYTPEALAADLAKDSTGR